jgi:hypothetical protein
VLGLGLQLLVLLYVLLDSIVARLFGSPYSTDAPAWLFLLLLLCWISCGVMLEFQQNHAPKEAEESEAAAAAANLSDTTVERLNQNRRLTHAQVRKTPSWPRSWANLSLL